MNPYSSELISEKYTDTQIAMQNALVSVYAKKNIHQITVKELCNTTSVARTTFYTYYQNIDELLEEIENTLFAYITETCEQFMYTPSVDENSFSFFDDTLCYIKENSKIFRLLMVEQPNIRFIEKWKNAIKYHFGERLFRARLTTNSGLILEIIAAETIAAFTYWLKHPADVDISKVKKSFLRSSKQQIILADTLSHLWQRFSLLSICTFITIF